jgi:hypothetical protein
VRRDRRNASVPIPDFRKLWPLHRPHFENRFLVTGRLDLSIAYDRAIVCDAVDLVLFHVSAPAQKTSGKATISMFRVTFG